jgi:signal transduction histidine kinase
MTAVPIAAGGTPIAWRIGALLLAAIVAVTAISFGAALLIASPNPPRMTAAAARDGLLGADGARAAGLRRTSWTSPPLPPSSAAGVLPAGAIADALHLPAGAVRVRMGEGGRLRGGPMLSVTGPSGSRTQRLSYPSEVEGLIGDPWLKGPLLSAALRMPLLAAAMRQPDGRWLMVEPAASPPSVWRLRLLAALAASAMLLAPLAWLAARRLTRPIRALADYARGAELDGTGDDPPATGPREVREAAAAIADMRARLEGQAAERSRMLAAVAHDLRTPLTGLRLRAETAPPEERRRMAADIARMDKMIAQVLAFASAEHGEEARERVDLAALMAQAAEEAEGHGRPVRFIPHPALPAAASPTSLYRALANLIDNAVRYGGEAELSLAREEGWAILRVADRGPGLPDDLLERVQLPFFRAEGSRNEETGGVGLGLAIARAVAERHEGRLVLRNRAGGGLVAELRLPLTL